MPRIPMLKPEEMDAEQRRVHDATLKATGRAGNGPSLAYVHAPELWEATNAVSAYFENRSSLSPAQIRIAALVTMRHWNADFPWAAQARMGLQAGLDAAAIDAINAKKKPALKSKEDEAVYAVAKEVIETGTLSDASFASAKSALGLRRLVDAAGVVAHFCGTAMMANLAGAQAPADAPSKLK